MGARGLPGRFVPRTRGARDNRGPFPGFSRVIPRLPLLFFYDTGLLREGDEELGLALLRVGLERAFGLPLLLDLGFQLEEGVSTRVGLRRGRWGGHGFACFFYACKLERCSLCDCSLACGSSAAMACKEAVVSNLQQLSP